MVRFCSYQFSVFSSYSLGQCFSVGKLQAKNGSLSSSKTMQIMQSKRQYGPFSCSTWFVSTTKSFVLWIIGFQDHELLHFKIFSSQTLNFPYCLTYVVIYFSVWLIIIIKIIIVYFYMINSFLYSVGSPFDVQCKIWAFFNHSENWQI